MGTKIKHTEKLKYIELRKQGKNQKETAQICNITPQTATRWEKEINTSKIALKNHLIQMIGILTKRAKIDNIAPKDLILLVDKIDEYKKRLNELN